MAIANNNGNHHANTHAKTNYYAMAMLELQEYGEDQSSPVFVRFVATEHKNSPYNLHCEYPPVRDAF